MPWKIDPSKKPVRLTPQDAQVMHLVMEHISQIMGAGLALAIRTSDPHLRHGMCKMVLSMITAEEACPMESVELVEWFKENDGSNQYRQIVKLIEDGKRDEALQFVADIAERPLLVYVVDPAVEVLRRD